MTETHDALLIEMLPRKLASALSGLPKRLLFQNEHVQMVMAGLARGQELADFSPPAPLLLVVAYGRILIRSGSLASKLDEGQDRRLEPDSIYQIRALDECDLMFFVPMALRAARAGGASGGKPPAAAAQARGHFSFRAARASREFTPA